MSLFPPPLPFGEKIKVRGIGFLSSPLLTKEGQGEVIFVSRAGLQPCESNADLKVCPT